MNCDVQTAIVGGLAAIIAPVVTLLTKDWIEKRRFPTPSTERLMAVVGAWKGHTVQAIGPNCKPLNVSLSADLMVARGVIYGKAFVLSEPANILVDVTGRFVSESCVRFDYRATDKNVLNFGTVFAVLSPNAMELRGRMVGYGSEAQMVVYGETILHKT